MKKHLLLMTLMCFLSISLSAQVIEKTYYFDNPVIEKYQDYERIEFGKSMQRAADGYPVLPWQSVSLLLPQNTEAQDIEFEFSDFVEIEGTHQLYPYQPARPLSVTEEVEFVKDADIYNSTDVYPSQAFGRVTTQYLNGYSVAFAGFTPVRYVPATGKVSYAKTVTVKLSVKASKSDKSKMLSVKPEIKARVERLVQNHEMLDTYKVIPELAKQRDADGYELLVITPEEWVSAFDEYKSFYDARGLRTRVTSLEDIYASAEGRDEQEKIRTYIAQEYEERGLMMVLLGGDSGLVPYRSLYCYVSEGYEDDLPADMYYVSLDGSWDDDNDGVWGEIGEDDLLPELAIGRMPFNNEQQFNNMMHKTLEYQRNPVMGEFNDIVLGGEHLGDGYYGSSDLEVLIGEQHDSGYTTIGIPEDYNFHRVYSEGETGWSGSIFRNKINEVGGGYVHHVGHANTDYVAGWYVNTTNDNSFVKLDGVTHNYNFFHSHGCICGDFTSTCMLERLVNISTGFVASTGNSRYGWYIPWGDGPARHLHREFVDSYYNDRLPYIGTAFVEMKIMTAPYVTDMWGENGALRWNMYCINILGDVAVCPWLDEPFIPEVEYEQALVQGTESTNIVVRKDGVAQNNFRCSLFNGDELIAFGLTDDEGQTELVLSEPLSTTDTLRLIITGPNAISQSYDVVSLPDNTSYVYANEIVIDDSEGNANGKLDYDETLSFSMNFFNPGAIATDNVTATLSTEMTDYVEIIDNQAEIGVMAADTELMIDDVFTIKIADDVPDLEYLFFTMDCTDGSDSWSQDFVFQAFAPVFEVDELVYDDSMGNGDGFVDPGETIQVILSGSNIGHSECFDIFVEASSSNPYVTFVEDNVTIAQLGEDEEFTAVMVLTVSEDTPDGEFFNVDVNMTSGSYYIHKTLMFTVGTVREDFEVGDFSHMNWKFEYDLPWTVTDNQAYNGTYSAQSGAIGDNQLSSMIIEINTTTDGVISFYFKTSTEKNRDFLVFYIDYDLQDRWSGENDWQMVTYEIPAGNHILEWRYDKNQSDQDGEDRCWIDDIIFPNNCVIMDVEAVSEQKNINVYPNPANDFIVVEGVDIQMVEIYNTLGMKLISHEVENSKAIMDISRLTNGMYIIKTFDVNSDVVIRKIIKK